MLIITEWAINHHTFQFGHEVHKLAGTRSLESLIKCKYINLNQRRLVMQGYSSSEVAQIHTEKLKETDEITSNGEWSQEYITTKS